MTSEALSFFNPLTVNNELLSFTYVKSVTHDPVNNKVIVVYSDGTSSDLGTYIPPTPASLSGARVSAGVLYFEFSDDTEIVVGNISSSEEYSYPLRTGAGLLTASGQHKPIVAANASIQITETETELNIALPDVGGGGGGSSVAGAFSLSQCSILHEVFTTATSGYASLGATVAGQFKKRTFNVTKADGLGLNIANGEFTLAPGVYWIDSTAQALGAGISYLQLKNVTTQTVALKGLVQRVYSTAASVCLTLSGYVHVTETATFAIEQYSELTYALGLGRGYFDATWGWSSVSAKMTLWKVASAPLANLPNELVELDQRSLDWKAIYDQRKDIGFDVRLEHAGFDENGFYYQAQCAFGNKLYLFPNFGHDSLMIVDTVTWEITYKQLPASVLADLLSTINGLWWYLAPPVFAEGKFYFVPYAASKVMIFDPVTETITFNNYGLTLTAAAKYATASYDSVNKKIVAVPMAATSILMIDVVANTASFETFGLTISTGNKWAGSVYANGFIYGTPYDATTIVKLDVATKTGTLISVGSLGSTKWYGAFYSAAQNKVIGLPVLRDDFLVIDCTNDSFTLNSFGMNLSSTDEYRVAVEHNGYAYAYPKTRNQILKVELATLTFSQVLTINPIGATIHYPPPAISANGWIIPVPQYLSIGTLFPTNPATGDGRAMYQGITSFGSGITSPDLKWGGVAIADNGKAYAFPMNASFAICFDSKNAWKMESSLIGTGINKWIGSVNVPGDGVYGVPGSSTLIPKIVLPTEQGTERDPAVVFNSEQLYFAHQPMLGLVTENRIAVSSSSFSGYPAWNAFKRTESTTATDCWTSLALTYNEASPHWVQITLEHPVKVDAFQIRLGYNYFPRQGRLIGSNDLVNWEELHRYNDSSGEAAFAYKPVWACKVEAPAYRHYRFEVFVSSHASYANVAELRLYTKERFDPNNKLGKITSVATVASGGTKFRGGNYCPTSNRIFFTPASAIYCGYYDLTTKQYGTVEGRFNMTDVYSYAAETKPGKLIAFSSAGRKILQIDTVKLTMSTKDIAYHGFAYGNDFACAVRGPNELVYGIPSISPYLGVWDSAHETFSLNCMGVNKTTASFGAGVISATGKMILAPYTQTMGVWVFDPYSQIMEKILTTDQGSDAYRCGVTFEDGTTVMLPYATTRNLLKIKPQVASPLPKALCLDHRNNGF